MERGGLASVICLRLQIHVEDSEAAARKRQKLYTESIKRQ